MAPAASTVVPTTSVKDAFPVLGATDERLLRSQGITTIEDLERVHFGLHLGDVERSRQYLMDVVGISNRGAVNSILQFLSSDPVASGTDEMGAYESMIVNMLGNYSGLSLDRLQNMLLASSLTPKYDKTRDQLASFLSYLVDQGKILADNGLYRSPQAGSSQQQRGRSSTPSHSSPSSSWSNNSSNSPSSSPPSWQQSNSGHNGSNGNGNGGSSSSNSNEDDALDQLAQFEGQVLDLLQNYSGATLERLESLLYMSGKQPKFTQGTARLQLLLSAMEAQGTIVNDSGVYRYRTRTPEPSRRSRSPTASRTRSSSPGSSSSSSRQGDMSVFEGRVLDVLQQYAGLPLERLNNMLRMAPGTPRYEGSPEQLSGLMSQMVQSGKVVNDNGVYRNPESSSRSSSPTSSSSRRGTPGAADLEPAVLDLLQNYAGLSMERLESLLASSPKTGYSSSQSSQLSSLLSRLSAEGKVTNDKGVYRFRSKSPALARRRSPTPARGSSASAQQPYRQRSPSGSRASGSPSAPRTQVEMAAFEPVVTDLLQSYSGLSLERLDNLLVASPKAAGYASNPQLLASLLSSMQSKGRVTADSNGVYRYVSSGKTPMPARARSPRAGSPRASPDPSTGFQPAAALGNLFESARRQLSPAAVAAGPAASSRPVEDWTPYEATLMTMLGNYGALPLDRLHDMLKMSMTWPRYDRTPAQLSSYLNSLVAGGKLVSEHGLYRKPGTAPVPRPPMALAAYEGQVLSALSTYSGLSLDRLQNVLRLSRPPYEGNQEDLGKLIASLIAQGKVTIDGGLYKLASSVSLADTDAVAPPKPASNIFSSFASSAASLLPRSSSPSSVPSNNGRPLSTSPGPVQVPAGDTIFDSLGFPTGEGTTGFVPFSEVVNGRLAMVGLLISVLTEVRSDMGTLEQLGLRGLPSIELYHNLLSAGGAAVALGTLVQLGRFVTNKMTPAELDRYFRVLTFKDQQVAGGEVFTTDELRYARNAELVNGRLAMVGFYSTLVMEALTGRGVVGQVALYLRLAGILGPDSGV